MTEHNNRISALTPKQKEILQLRLKEKRVQTGKKGHAHKRPRNYDDQVSIPYNQNSLWFLQQLNPDLSAYNCPVILKFEGFLNIDALEWSINQIISRHETLRMTFQTKEGKPYIKITEKLDCRLEVLVLEEENQINRVIKSEIQQPFDLEFGPLFRTKLIEISKNNFILITIIHHIVFDSWSMKIFINELETFYYSYLNRTETNLPELLTRYTDYCVEQNELISKERLYHQREYWIKQLKNVNHLCNLPIARNRIAVQTYNGSRTYFSFSSGLLFKLQKLSRFQGTTMYMTMIAAWMVLIHRYTKQDDVVVGSPISIRQVETEPLIGLFINTLVINANAGGNPTFCEFLQRVRTNCLNAFSNQDYPFEMLLNDLKIERTQSYAPLTQIKFVYQYGTKIEQKNNLLSIDTIEVDLGTSKTDLIIDMTENQDSIQGRIEFSTDLFDEENIKGLIRHYERLLEKIVENPHSKLWSLNFFDSHDSYLNSFETKHKKTSFKKLKNIVPKPIKF